MSLDLSQVFDAPVHVQIAAISLATFLQEDVSALLTGLALAAEDLEFWPCAIGIFTGAMLANLAFWFAGRLLGPAAFKLPGLRGAEKSGSLAKAQARFKRSGFVAIFVSRFLPGTRIPVCALAGILRMSFPRFFLYSLTAVLPWTAVMLLIPDRIYAWAKSGLLWWILPVFLAGAFWAWRWLHHKEHKGQPAA
jgi:membrane protein DedA with SNARE-associated domain